MLNIEGSTIGRIDQVLCAIYIIPADLIGKGSAKLLILSTVQRSNPEALKSAGGYKWSTEEVTERLRRFAWTK